MAKAHQFKKGEPRPANAGRKKGTPNKRTALLKDAIILAAQKAGHDVVGGGKKTDDGLVKYLHYHAIENPNLFMPLVGKVLPMQLVGNAEDGEINISIQFVD